MTDIQCGLQKLPEFKLVSGVGNYSHGEACVMSAAVACWRLSQGMPMGEATDEMDCCCPVIRRFLIRLNDSSLWRDANHRTEILMPFVPRLAGTRNSALVQKRLFILADWAIRKIAADAMEFAKLPDQAQSLRSLQEVVDKQTALTAMATTLKAKQAAAYAAYAAYAAADAAYAAYAAAYAAYAAASRRDAIIQDCVTVLNRLLALSE